MKNVLTTTTAIAALMCAGWANAVELPDITDTGNILAFDQATFIDEFGSTGDEILDYLDGDVTSAVLVDDIYAISTTVSGAIEVCKTAAEPNVAAGNIVTALDIGMNQATIDNFCVIADDLFWSAEDDQTLVAVALLAENPEPDVIMAENGAKIVDDLLDGANAAAENGYFTKMARPAGLDNEPDINDIYAKVDYDDGPAWIEHMPAGSGRADLNALFDLGPAGKRALNHGRIRAAHDHMANA